MNRVNRQSRTQVSTGVPLGTKAANRRAQCPSAFIDTPRRPPVCSGCRGGLTASSQRQRAVTAEVVQREERGNKPLVSIVAPVYNEEQGVNAFYEQIRAVLAPIDWVETEFVFVDDGSTDGSREKLAELCRRDSRVRAISFSRNFGHQVAITAGLDHAVGDAVVVIDSDLQDPPAVVPAMLEKWQEGFDVVYGIRRTRRGESFFKLATAGMFYWTIKRLSPTQIPRNVGDFRLMSRRVVEQMRRLTERERFVRGLVSWVGFPQTGVLYDRDSRYTGETKYPLRKMIRFALDAVTSFSTRPLRLATVVGLATSGVAFLYMLSVFAQKLAGVTVPGFATIMVSMLFLGGVQLICIGIIGEYIGRMYTELKARPMYVVKDTMGGHDPQPETTPGDVPPQRG